MADIADYLMSNFIDCPEEESRIPDRVPARSVVRDCKYCGARNLSWKLRGGKWRLYHVNGRKHSCEQYQRSKRIE